MLVLPASVTVKPAVIVMHDFPTPRVSAYRTDGSAFSKHIAFLGQVIITHQ